MHWKLTLWDSGFLETLRTKIITHISHAIYIISIAVVCLFIYFYINLDAISSRGCTHPQGNSVRQSEQRQQKCILPLKDRKTRGTEAGGREDKGLLWTETAENTETRRVPSTKVPTPCMITLSKDPQEIYSVLHERGEGGRGWGSTLDRYKWAERVPHIFMISILHFFLVNGSKWKLLIEISLIDFYSHRYLHISTQLVIGSLTLSLLINGKILFQIVIIDLLKYS